MQSLGHICGVKESVIPSAKDRWERGRSEYCGGAPNRGKMGGKNERGGGGAGILQEGCQAVDQAGGWMFGNKAMEKKAAQMVS